MTEKPTKFTVEHSVCRAQSVDSDDRQLSVCYADDRYDDCVIVSRMSETSGPGDRDGPIRLLDR